MDTRLDENHRESIINRVSGEDGVPSCDKHYVCNRVCPKGVKPGTAIKNIRENYLSS
jgi:succinate dehydrogenase/fumarate reductase-like Fe-S protein